MWELVSFHTIVPLNLRVSSPEGRRLHDVGDSSIIPFSHIYPEELGTFVLPGGEGLKLLQSFSVVQDTLEEVAFVVAKALNHQASGIIENHLDPVHAWLDLNVRPIIFESSDESLGDKFAIDGFLQFVKVVAVDGESVLDPIFAQNGSLRSFRKGSGVRVDVKVGVIAELPMFFCRGHHFPT